MSFTNRSQQSHTNWLSQTCRRWFWMISRIILQQSTQKSNQYPLKLRAPTAIVEATQLQNKLALHLMAWFYYKQETNLHMIPGVILWLWWYKPIFVEVTTSSFSSKILLENNLQCIQTGLTILDEYFCLQLLKSKVSWMAWYCFQDAFTTAASPCFCPTAVSVYALNQFQSLLFLLLQLPQFPLFFHPWCPEILPYPTHTPYLSLYCSPLCSLTALSRNFSFTWMLAMLSRFQRGTKNRFANLITSCMWPQQTTTIVEFKNHYWPEQ